MVREIEKVIDLKLEVGLHKGYMTCGQMTITIDLLDMLKNKQL